MPTGIKPKFDRKRTLALLIAACVLLVGALTWRILLEKNSLASRIVRELAAHGCTVDASALYQHEHRSGTSIRAMMGEKDMTAAAEVSRAAGFPSDIDRQGEVYCLLAQLENGRVLTVFVVDEQTELAFIQIPDSDEVLPVNAQ